MTVSQIDTRFGTYNSSDYSNGNTLPYTGLPFGRQYFVPQTLDTTGSWFFSPIEPLFYGFRLTHQPSPWMGDFAHFNLIPFCGEVKGFSLYGLKSSYDTKSAIYQPHHLSMELNRYQIKAELTPNEYGAKIRCRYKISDQSGLAFYCPGVSNVTFNQETSTINGTISNFSDCEDPNFTMYFALKVEHEQTNQPKIDASLSHFGDSNKQMTYALYFNNLIADTTLVFSLATSFISQEQAFHNLEKEIHIDFDTTKAIATQKWNEKLNKIEVQNHNPEPVAIFKHCLYHCFLFPHKMYEYNQQDEPVHYDTHNRTIQKGVFYTNNGFWDTSKTLFPLFSLIARNEYREMLEGFLNYYKEVGYLPKWLSPDERGLMPGTLIDAVIAEAASSHIADDLLPEFLEAMIQTATKVTDKIYGREGSDIYQSKGYLPDDLFHESINKSLDYCYSDYCISQVAKKLNQTSVAENYLVQSKNFKNLFDDSSLFLAPKKEDGSFSDDFTSHRWGHCYTEGSAWQNAFNLYHDIPSLVNLHPTENSFLNQVKALCNQKPLFTIGSYPTEIHEMSEAANGHFGQIAISNQPSFHLPYLFHYTKEPYWTEIIVKQALQTLFSNDYFAYPGDEDNGSLSAWYIFNSLGFYPFCPGSSEYLIGISAFDSATIHLDNGEKLVIETKQNTPAHQFVTQVTFNQAMINNRILPTDELQKGGRLIFNLGLVAPGK